MWEGCSWLASFYTSQTAHDRFSLDSQPLPVFPPWQNDVEVVVREELLIAMWALRERKLNGLSS
jgi:hypothetical protein